MNKNEFRLDVMACDIAEENTRPGQTHGYQTRLELAAQIHAHDPSLPADLEGQVRVLLEQRALAFAFLEAAEKCRSAIGLPEHQDLIAATTEAINKLVATFLRGQDPPSLGIPDPPPPPPPTKAVEGES